MYVGSKGIWIMEEKLGKDTDRVLTAQKILSKLLETWCTEYKRRPACPAFSFFQGINY